MKSKIEIKHWITDSILFEFECDGNSIMNTIIEAVKLKKDLRGADLQGKKIKTAYAMAGLYDYVVIPYITEENEQRVKMGCHDRTVKEWDEDFWNNTGEFPNDNSVKSQCRVMAYQTAKKWLEIIEPTLEK